MRIGLVCLLSLGLLTFGCGDDDGVVGDDGGADGAMDDAAGDDGGGDDAGDDDAGGDDAGGDDAGGDDAAVDDAGPGSCTDNSMCERSEYCAAPALSRDMCDGAGMCEARPEGCSRELDPVCGCDGVDYTNPCEANRAGARVASNGMCPTDECELTPTPTCCYVDDHCTGRGLVCRGAACVRGGQGTCVDAPADGECWTNADCADGERCDGAFQCPCGALCILPDAVGSCVGRSDT